MKATAYILDDEESARGALMLLLRDYCPNIEVVGSSGTIENAFKDICRLKPKILFLDIHLTMGGNYSTSFELLEQLPEYEYEVVFVTAFEKYAVKAFKTNAVGYLLKPVSIAELITAVELCQDRLKWKTIKPRMSDLFAQLSSEVKAPERIWIHSVKEVIPVKIKDIIRVQAEGKCTDFHCLEGRKVTSSKNLGEYVELLEEHGFIQVHRAHMINPTLIKKYQKFDGGWVIMDDDSEVPVSKRSKEKILAIL